MSERRQRMASQQHLAVPGVEVVRRYVRHLGPRRTLFRSAYVLVNQVVPITVLDCITLDREDVNPEFLQDDGSFECRFLDPAEIRRLPEDPLLDLTAEIVEERLANGDLCHAVIDGDVVAMVGWYSNRPTTILGDLAIHFHPDRWFMHGGWTRADYRGRRLHAIGVCRAFVALHERGVKGLVSTWERTNYATIRSARRMGWRRFGSLVRVRAFGRSLTAATSGCAIHGVRAEIRTGSGPHDA